MKTTTQRLTMAGAALAVALVLAGCAPASDTAGPAGPAAETPTTAPESPATEPVEQAASCEWDTAQLQASAPVIPEGTAGELATVLVGSWQHTHYDSGEGFTAMDDTDIRYVFATTEQLIYCQHVPGATDHAENKAPITLEGALISPPSPHPGFEVTAWNENAMLWLNNLDGSTYLLVRR